VTQIWPCRACGRILHVDDDGHCADCQRVELITDGGRDTESDLEGVTSDSRQAVDGDGETAAIAQKVSDEIAAGKYRCPSCGEKDGLIASASCTFCGHIPEEHRA
jgi:hypothetical protein